MTSGLRKVGFFRLCALSYDMTLVHTNPSTFETNIKGYMIACSAEAEMVPLKWLSAIICPSAACAVSFAYIWWSVFSHCHVSHINQMERLKIRSEDGI